MLKWKVKIIKKNGPDVYDLTKDVAKENEDIEDNFTQFIYIS